MGLKEHFRRIFSRRKQPSAENVEALRLDFKERYHNFKLLINANNKALQAMADMEFALQGNRLFDMTFVRSRSTAISVNIYQMVEKLNLLSKGKYLELNERFKDIKDHIDRLLTLKKSARDDRLVILLDNIDKDMADFVGSKMANLGELKNRIHLVVPGGFVITSQAYQRFFEHNGLDIEINRRIQSVGDEEIQRLYTLSAEIQQLIIQSEIPQDLADAILNAWQQTEREVGGPITAALRSSALGEDAAGSSFAGQYRSELNISSDNVLQAYKEIIASKYSLQAVTYRIAKGIRDEDIAMCVGCVVMIDAQSGGVIYSRSPVDIHDESIFINAAWGLPKAVVDGTVDCDLFVISRSEPLELVHEEIHKKEKKFICYPVEGVCRIDLTDEEASNQPSLTPDQAITLAEIALKLENHYGYPQDIEWAIGYDGEIYILQCRPLQQQEAVSTRVPEKGREGKEKTLLTEGGVTASPGAASGLVYRAEREVDMLRFQTGAVLVVKQALPRWAPIVSRAAGIVSEQGGFAGHLANVAREFGVPALFGVSGVFEKVKNGETITVDASGRTLHRGRIEYLLKAPATRKGIVETSPVYETLKAISKHIVPLNLLDPDSPDFKPAACRTYHDITRFVHEKSVLEMFDFGREHQFAERSSKQLYFKAPMQWWILNLDDGFKEEVDGKYVKLDNIVSTPMLAFWEGFTAIPWDGPPAIDGKGLMSVMFQSTANTALTPGVRSRFADRNYFMISKHFCNLSSRLGYHFSTLEALVSERKGENYIKFQFKGGAADYQRKVRRVRFISDLLEKYGFRVEVTEDNLLCRIEDQDLEYMKKRLKIIGYLTIHTRQIDMIMSNENAVKHYWAKFTKDIDYLLKEHQPVYP